TLSSMSLSKAKTKLLKKIPTTKLHKYAISLFIMFLEEKQIPYPDRCPICYMRFTHCICDSIPKLTNAIPLTLVMHAREAYKTTNTGRLAHLSLQNSRVLIRGDRKQILQTEKY